jgi:hypothetical protein
MIQKLPLFPLGLVLFPNAPLPLHIFEERYKLMISRCVEQNAPFGVVLLREGVAESTDVSFHTVGTTAQISDGIKLDDGRYLINTTGQRRFRIQYVAQREPYYVASVSFLSEESTALVTKPADELRILYDRYWNALVGATGYQHEPETLPDDVIDLTYWMAHRLQVDVEQKQRWLEADVSTRLSEMIAALRAELSLLPDASGPNDRTWIGPGSWN